MNLVERCDARLGRMTLREIRVFVVLLSAVCLLPAWHNFGIVAMDATSLYIPTARMFSDGDFGNAIAQPHPLYAFLIYLLTTSTGLGFEIAGRLVAAFNFILAALALFEIVSRISKDKLAAFVAVILLIFNPELVQRSVDCLKESLLVAIVLWANYLILFSRKRIFGCVIGMAMLLIAMPLRSTVLFFIIGWIAVWALLDPKCRRRRVALSTLFILLFSAGVFVCQGSHFFYKNDLSFEPIIMYLKQIDASRLRFAIKIIAEFIATGGYMAVIAGIFGFMKVENRAWQINAACVLIGVFFVILMLGWMSDRFLLLPLAWFYPAAAVGLVSWLRDSRKMLCVLAIMTLVSLPVIWSYKTFKEPNPVMVHQKVAGLWIKDQFGPNSEVYSNRPRLIFYAGAKTVEKPIKLAAVDMHHREDAAFFAGMATSSGLVPVKSIGYIVIYQKKDNNRPAGVPDNKH